jgi:hypothetical protein
MLEGIMAVALENRPRYRPLSRQAQELRDARICYDHLAGRLSVDLADFFAEQQYIIFDDEAAEVTPDGIRFLTDFGIDLAVGAKRRHLCRSCLDWTERRSHIGGAVGAAIANRLFDLHWTERIKNSRAVIVTTTGAAGLWRTFGIGSPKEGHAHSERG